MERLSDADVDSLPKAAIFERGNFAGAVITETPQKDGVQRL